MPGGIQSAFQVLIKPGSRRKKHLLVQLLPNDQVGTGGTCSWFFLRWTILRCSLQSFLGKLGPSLTAVIILLNNISWDLIFFLSLPSFPIFFGINFLKQTIYQLLSPALLLERTQTETNWNMCVFTEYLFLKWKLQKMNFIIFQKFID